MKLNEWTKRQCGNSTLHFQVIKGAFGAAYIQGSLIAPNREQASKDFDILKKACDGLPTGGWLADDGHCPFEVRVENKEYIRDFDPFKEAFRMIKQSNLNKYNNLQ